MPRKLPISLRKAVFVWSLSMAVPAPRCIKVANWPEISRVVEAVSIPVLANGDITSPQIAKTAIARSGAHGVMVGRAATGPAGFWHKSLIFWLTGRFVIARTWLLVICSSASIWICFLAIMALRGCVWRKHLAAYCDYLPASHDLRAIVTQSETVEPVFAGLARYFEQVARDAA